MNKRITQLQQEMKKNQVDQLLITDYYNLKYYSDITIHAGERLLVLIVNQNTKPILLINDLFPLEESMDYTMVRYHDSEDSIRILANQLYGHTIAVDDNLKSGFLLRLMKYYPASYQTTTMMKMQRAIKDYQERAYLLQASVDNDEVMRRIVPYLKKGITEKEVVSYLKELFYLVTKDRVSFNPIVAFGINGADPHHVPDDTALEENQTIIIDMGCYHKGYCSDMTRTFLYRGTDMEEIYKIVLEANKRAIEGIKTGIPLSQVDAIARDVITKAGYGEYFTHRTGHGVGLEIHEGYDVSISEDTLIEEGMCFSIEPGIYLPGRGGVRIEDLVLVEKDRVIVLNHYPKDQYIID